MSGECSVTVVIPARLGSVRFPEKVLAAETGRPLVRHVYDAASACLCADRVVVATDHARVADAVRRFGGAVVMTSPDHDCGTSRIAEAADTLDIADRSVVVNVQGDEPEMEPSLIDAAVEALLDSDAPMASVASPFAPGENPSDPAIVKVVLRADGRALYFSRSLIPFDRDNLGPAGGARPPLKHIGLYVFRRAFLRDFASWPVSSLERTERLEQLRALENGADIAMAIRESRSQGIDTPAQYAAFVKRWKALHG